MYLNVPIHGMIFLGEVLQFCDYVVVENIIIIISSLP